MGTKRGPLGHGHEGGAGTRIRTLGEGHKDMNNVRGTLGHGGHWRGALGHGHWKRDTRTRTLERDTRT